MRKMLMYGFLCRNVVLWLFNFQKNWLLLPGSRVQGSHDRYEQMVHLIEKLFAERGNGIIFAVCTLMRGLQMTFQNTVFFKAPQLLVEVISVNIKGTAGDG